MIVSVDTNMAARSKIWASAITITTRPELKNIRENDLLLRITDSVVNTTNLKIIKRKLLNANYSHINVEWCRM